MRLQMGGIDVRLGSLVVEMQGEVIAIQEKIPQKEGGRPYFEIAVAQKTGTFALQAFGERPGLEEEEKYIFTVSVENDSYGQAKQPRLQYLAHKPYVKMPPTVPMPSREAAFGGDLGKIGTPDEVPTAPVLRDNKGGIK